MLYANVTDGKNTFALPLENVGTNSLLSESCLKAFFPAANALLCDEEGHKNKAVLFKNGYYYLLPLIGRYRVHNSQADSPIQNNKYNKIEKTESNKLTYFKNKILGISDDDVKSDCKDSEFDAQPSISSTQKAHKVKNLKESFQVRLQLPKKESKLQTVTVGWKHRENFESKYVLQKKIKSFGGQKILHLNKDEIYSVEDIINLSVKEFTCSTMGKELLGKSNTKLGLYSDDIIESFATESGVHIGIWEYFRLLQKTKITVYLMSTPRIDDQDFKEQDDESLENSSSSNFPTKNKSSDTVDADTNVAHQEISNGDAVDIIPISLNNNKEIDLVDRLRLKYNVLNDDPPISTSQSINAVIKTSNNTQNNDGTLLSSDEEKSCSSMNNNEMNFSIINMSLNQINTASTQLNSNASNSVDKIIGDIYQSANIAYWGVQTSKYTEIVTIMELNREGAFTKFTQDCRDNGHADPDQDQFHPTDHFEICNITINNQILFSVAVDENFGRHYTLKYPSEESRNSSSHPTLLYDLDEIYGFDMEKFGIGVIASCTVECCCNVSWYCNEELFEQGPMLYWISIGYSNKDCIWHCTINCQKSKTTIRSKRVLIRKWLDDISSPSIFSTVNVPQIPRDELIINKKNKIGCGTQGSVYHGTYNFTPVAVKTIQNYPDNIKNLKSEMAVMETIRHPKFIFLMGTSWEKKQVHLVMEYFPSTQLANLIHDADVQEEYFKLDTGKKNYISHQLCVALYHLQTLKIVHRDIKPQNILIDKLCNLKICDFGLSRFTSAITTLTQTCSPKGIVGTYLYMAPEIILHNRRASEKSDIWSMACTILETFKEDCIWGNINGLPDLKETLENQSCPDLSSIPQNIVECLKKCFDYDPGKRPSPLHLIRLFPKDQKN